jgi:predicted Zn-dependent protease
MTGKRKISQSIGTALLGMMVVLSSPSLGRSETQTAEQTLEICLKKAEQYPDIAVADSEAWMERGGGDAARLCHANGLYNRSDYDAAGREFAALASKRNGNINVVSLYMQAGVAFARVKETKNAEIQFAKALHLQPDNAEIWFDRATARVTVERYWDAIDDLNHALSLMPKMGKAYRLRGQSWMHLGNTKNATADLDAAETFEGIKDDGEPLPPTAR